MSAVEGISSRIEDSFAKAGQQLGRGHTIFQGLSQALATLSAELSGTQIDGASDALHDVANKLNGLAEALPAESALLSGLGSAAMEASELLKPVFKHIQMISIIARSARIEAASLTQDREGFLAFTQEAYELAKAVQQSLEACARDQARLSKAVDNALNKQKDFEQRYHARLLSEASDLISAYSGLQEQRSQSVRLTELAGRSTRKVADAVGHAVVSLQAGDSTRQRLEHVCHGLKVASGSTESIVPGDGAPETSIICRLQAMQMKDAERELQQDIGEILGALSAIMSDATSVVSQARSLYGSGGDDSSSFLTRIRHILSEASTLIATCETAGRSVDDALTVVEQTLNKFRDTIAGLSEAVVDITLIGMNASLKAGHLGSKGNAFVVIANELKATADQVSAAAARLAPTLDEIGKSANDLRVLRLTGNRMQLSRLEPQILHTLRRVEDGNEQLGGLVEQLTREGAEFEGLMNSASQLMRVLGEAAATLPAAAQQLDALSHTAPGASLPAADRAILDDLFARYTMERERDVHRQLLQHFGLAPTPPQQTPLSATEETDDGVLLF